MGCLWLNYRDQSGEAHLFSEQCAISTVEFNVLIGPVIFDVICSMTVVPKAQGPMYQPTSRHRS
jgi:hypothetical protein